MVLLIRTLFGSVWKYIIAKLILCKKNHSPTSKYKIDCKATRTHENTKAGSDAQKE
jgi:hypothetical protein